MAHLSFYQGDRSLLTHLLRPGRTVIGRSDRCDVALPSDALSRTHCTIDQRSEGWVLTDRSRHGTWLGQERVQRHLLQDGDVFHIGEYRVGFRSADHVAEPATATLQRSVRPHEELIEADDEGVATARVVLRFLGGPHAGSTLPLTRSRTSLGGAGSDSVLDSELPRKAFYLRVVRGRALVEPGLAAVFLSGQRVRELTPVLFGEAIRCASHRFVIESETRSEAVERTSFGAMVGESEGMRRLFGVLDRIAAHDAPALIIGESGTGKELAARGLHESGPRSDGPFVAVNCAGIPHSLFESELFGHEKGAFTGATDRRDGAFHRAHNGTLFLDELGELQLDAQAKLLRVLESGEVRRVGGGAPEYPDVRIVAATNRDLPDMIHQGTFREDLYFRLAVLSVSIPPLSERAGDIPHIAQTLLARTHPDAVLTPGAEAALTRYEWPGNVRELRNVLTRAYVLAGPRIDAANLSFNPVAFHRRSSPPRKRPAALTADAIEGTLLKHDGNRTRTAAELGIPRSTLLYKMNKMGIS